MAYLICGLVAQPTGFWENIIFGFSNSIGNYAVAIILLTICIKLVMLPIDYFNRRSSTKMQEVQNKLAPKMAEIKKRYPDPQTQNQKMNELYQKEGFNPMGSCLTMLVVMVLSMVVFFTLFGSLNNMAAYKITNQYEQLQRAYVQEYIINQEGITKEEFNNLEFKDGKIGEYNVGDCIITISTSQLTYQSGDNSGEKYVDVANESVKQKYEQVKESFLWIKNVWIADSPLAKEIPDFNTYVTTAKITFNGDEESVLAKQQYDAVMLSLQNNAGVNGYFLLAILTGVTAFLYQYLLTKKKKQKENFYTKNAEQNPAANSGKAMLIILPIIMVVFTLSYNSIFALYIIASQLVGMATAPLINKLLNIKFKREQKK